MFVARARIIVARATGSAARFLFARVKSDGQTDGRTENKPHVYFLDIPVSNFLIANSQLIFLPLRGKKGLGNKLRVWVI